MAVAVEDATEVRAFAAAHVVADGNVGIEAGVHITPIFGVLHLLAEGVPICCRADWEVVFLHLVAVVDGRLATLHIHINIIMYARAREVHHLVALCALGLVEHIGEAVDHFAGTVLRHDAQHHLGTVVPHGIVFAGIVPCHAHGVGSLVFPVGRAVRHAQQVKIIHDTPDGRGAVVVRAPAPLFGNRTPHTVGEVVQRAAILQHACFDGFNQGAVDESVGRLFVAFRYKLLINGLEVFFLAGQRALYLEEVGGREVLIVQIRHVPCHFHHRLPAA